jgi:hypothetical protein
MKIGVFSIITKSQIAKFTTRKLEPERNDFALLFEMRKRQKSYFNSLSAVFPNA